MVIVSRDRKILGVALEINHESNDKNLTNKVIVSLHKKVLEILSILCRTGINMAKPSMLLAVHPLNIRIPK